MDLTELEGVDVDEHIIDVFTPKTLIREAGEWYEHEGPPTVEVQERADQVQGADKTTRWLLWHGRSHAVDKGIAAELVAAGFGDRLRLLTRPKPPALRVVAPVVDAASQFHALQARADQQDATIAAQAEQIAMLTEALRIPAKTKEPANG